MLFGLTDLPVPVLDVPAAATGALNQTYGWGCESGDAYGSGTSFDGGGVGTNQADVDVWKVYSAVGNHDASHTASTQLAESEKPVLGDEVIDFPAPYGDVKVPVDELEPYVYGMFGSNYAGPPLSPLLHETHVPTAGAMQLADTKGEVVLGDEVFDFTGNAGDVHVPVDEIKPYMYANDVSTSALAAKGTCNFTCDPNTASCGHFSEPLGSGACSGITITQNTATESICVGSTCVQAEPGSIELQYAQAPPPLIPSDCTLSSEQARTKGFRPTPAHFVMAAHAVLYGCVTATGKMLSGEGQKGFEGWRADFLSEATGAADAVTPVGGYLLRRALD